MTDETILEKLEELAGSNCSMHNDVWTGFTLQLNKLLLEQNTHRAELNELKETTKGLRELTLTISEQNFRIDKLLDSMKEHKKDNDVLFKKFRAHDDKFNDLDRKCPLEKQKLESTLSSIETKVGCVEDDCKEERNKIKKGIEKSVDEKIETVKSGQSLFRWILSIFILISITISGYNIDQTIKLDNSIRNIHVDCEKLKQRHEFMLSTITDNKNQIDSIIKGHE